MATCWFNISLIFLLADGCFSPFFDCVEILVHVLWESHTFQGTNFVAVCENRQQGETKRILFMVSLAGILFIWIESYLCGRFGFFEESELNPRCSCSCSQKYKLMAKYREDRCVELSVLGNQLSWTPNASCFAIAKCTCVRLDLCRVNQNCMRKRNHCLWYLHGFFCKGL